MLLLRSLLWLLQVHRCYLMLVRQVNLQVVLLLVLLLVMLPLLLVLSRLKQGEKDDLQGEKAQLLQWWAWLLGLLPRYALLGSCAPRLQVRRSLSCVAQVPHHQVSLGQVSLLWALQLRLLLSLQGWGQAWSSPGWASRRGSLTTLRS